MRIKRKKKYKHPRPNLNLNFKKAVYSGQNAIVTIVDEKWLEYSKQLFSSIFYNCVWNGDYVLIAQDVPEERLEWFKQRGIITINKTRKYKEGPVPVERYGKHYIFNDYFKRWTRVIYMDVDIIVKQPIFEMLETKGFGAVIDFSPKLKDHFDRKIDSELYKELTCTYDLTKSAFNSGVFVLETSLLNQELYDKMEFIADKWFSICKFEQSILNLLFYDRCVFLDKQYNHFFSRPYRMRQAANQKIIHFIMNNKPWKEASPYYQEWSENLSKAGYIRIEDLVKKRKI